MAKWKTKRRIMHSMKLAEISGVDNPAQEGARVTLMKRAPGLPAPSGDAADQFIKMSFQQAMDESLMERRFCQVFYEAFDGIYAANEAFRTALKDQYANSEETVRQYVEEVARVARETAEATKTLTKGQGVDSIAAKNAVETAIAKMAERLEKTMPKITTEAALATAVAAFALAKSTAQEAMDIIDAAEALDAFDVLDANADLSKMAGDKKKKKDEMAAMKRKLDVLEMPAEVRKHYDALPDDAKDTFMAKSADERAADVAKANAEDPVTYVCKDGTEIRKSDGRLAAMLAKRADEQGAELAKLRGETSAATMAKRAANEFPNVAEAVATSMLKSVAAVGEDTDEGKTVLATLKRMNAANGDLFKAAGDPDTDTNGEADGTAMAKWNEKVSDIAKRDSIPVAQAMSKARTEAPDLHKAAFPEVAAA
jgi:hypothetical protein